MPNLIRRGQHIRCKDLVELQTFDAYQSKESFLDTYLVGVWQQPVPQEAIISDSITLSEVFCSEKDWIRFYDTKTEEVL